MNMNSYRFSCNSNSFIQHIKILMLPTNIPYNDTIPCALASTVQFLLELAVSRHCHSTLLAARLDASTSLTEFRCSGYLECKRVSGKRQDFGTSVASDKTAYMTLSLLTETHSVPHHHHLLEVLV